MKKISLLIIVALIVACTSDDSITEYQEFQEVNFEVIYDSQDNVVKLNGVWKQSIDLGSWEPANDSPIIEVDGSLGSDGAA